MKKFKVIVEYYNTENDEIKKLNFDNIEAETKIKAYQFVISHYKLDNLIQLNSEEKI